MEFLSNDLTSIAIRSKDWSSHPLGGPKNWPLELKLSIASIIRSSQPSAIYWSNEYYFFYNESFLTCFNLETYQNKIGLSGEDVWGEDNWTSFLLPLFKDVYAGKRTNLITNKKIKLFKNTHYENTYWTYYATPVLNSNFDINGVLLNCNDLTNSYDVQLELSDFSEGSKEFVLLAESMPQIVWLANSAGKNEYCNTKWIEFTGQPQSFAKGWGFFDIFHPDDKAKCLKKWNRCLSVFSEFSVECRLKASNGDYKWFLISAQPFFYKKNSSEIRWVGTCTNIHENKIISEKLAESEDKLQFVLGSSGVGLWEYDVFKKEVYLSETLMIDWMINQDTFTFDDAAFKQIIHPKDLERVIRSLEHSVECAQKYQEEMRVLRSNGEIIWILTKGDVVLTKSGRVEKITGISINITEQKLTENKLKKAMRDAESANSLKSAFLANISHEIRTPLGVIAGFNDLLVSEEVSKEEKKRYSNIVSKTTEQITQIINDVLDLSKVESGVFTTESIEFSIKEIIQDTLDAFKFRLLEKKLQMDVFYDKSVPDKFVSDPMRIKQILFNLLSNAVKFTENGGIKVYVESVGEILKIKVEDSGIGIAKRKHSKLFKPFSQSDISMTRKYGGTGLGLALSKRLAELMGGYLVLEKSIEGLGSTFTFTVLKMETEDRLEPELKESAQGELELVKIDGAKVLLVEDSIENQTLFKLLLEKKHLEIQIANNGLEGMDMALGGEFDIILMDIQMPVLDGFSATKKLREAGYRKPIIALTAHALSEVREQCLGVGFTDYATKPLDVNALYSKIQTHINTSKQY